MLRFGRSVLPQFALMAVATLTPLVAQSAPGQLDRPGWRLGLGVSVYEIDDLAGSPMIPTGWLARTLGRHGMVSLTLHGIRNAGFYSTDALAGELDLGVRLPGDRAEVTLSAGPSGILGGDSDGTPYTGGGFHGAAGTTIWLARGVGMSGRVSARRWWGVGNAVLWAGSLGLSFEL